MCVLFFGDIKLTCEKPLTLNENINIFKHFYLVSVVFHQSIFISLKNKTNTLNGIIRIKFELKAFYNTSYLTIASKEIDQSHTYKVPVA